MLPRGETGVWFVTGMMAAMLVASLLDKIL